MKPWATSSLEAVGRWLSGGTPSKQNLTLWDGGVPWVSPKDMKRPRISDAIDHVSEAAVGNGTQFAPEGSLLMVVRGMILAHSFPVALTTAPVTFNQDIKALVPADGWSSEYLLFWLQHAAADMLRLVDVANHGTKRLPTERLFAMTVPQPPLGEQRKIAAILSAVDESIEATQAIVDQLHVVKKALMSELLTRGIPGRHTRFKQSDIGEIPGNWDLVLLDSVARRGSGHTPSKSHPEYWDGSIKWVSLQDSKRLDRLYIRDTAAKITPLGVEHSSATEHPAGTVVLSRDAGVGKSAITTDIMAVSQHFMAWVCGPRLSNHYLYYWLQRMKPEFERIAIGNTIKTIGLPYFKGLRLALPPREEQDEIARALTSCDERLFAEENARDALGSLKSGLMAALLSGAVRVGPDETAG